MNLRTRFRRWRIGADRYDRTVMAIRAVENAEEAGRAKAEAWIRANGLTHLIRDDSTEPRP